MARTLAWSLMILPPDPRIGFPMKLAASIPAFSAHHIERGKMVGTVASKHCDRQRRASCTLRTFQGGGRGRPISADGRATASGNCTCSR